MNELHLHLILTHLPVVGILGVILILAAGLWWRQEAILRVGLGLMVLVGLAAGAAYVTGEGAEEVVEHRALTSEAAIEAHEEAAKVAMVAGSLVAILAAGTLVMALRRSSRKPAVVGVLCGAVVVAGLMAYAANLGGRIGHPEAYAAQSMLLQGDRSGPGED